MNILVIEDEASSQKGGAERSMRKWCEYMAQKEHPVFFVYAHSGDFLGGDAGSIYRSSKKIDLSPVGEQGIFNWLLSIYALYRFCRKNKIELIFTHTIHAFPALRIVKALFPVSIGVYFKWVYSQSTPGKFALWGLKGIDKAMANSQYVANYWKNHGVRFASKPVVPNGIPPSETSEGNADGPLTEDTFSILFAGRIYPEKGLHLLIEALSKIQTKAWKLFIAGYFSTTEEHDFQSYHLDLIQRIQEYQLQGKIEFLGFTSQLRRLIRQADLVVVPSTGAEAQSIVLMEAMAESTLVIGSKVGGIPERLSGKLSKFLFEPDAEQLALKIEEIIEMPEDEKEKYKNILLTEFNAKYHIETTWTLINQNFEINSGATRSPNG